MQINERISGRLDVITTADVLLDVSSMGDLRRRLTEDAPEAMRTPASDRIIRLSTEEVAELECAEKNKSVSNHFAAAAAAAAADYRTSLAI